MAQGIQAPSALQNFFNANSGLTSLFNRSSNNNASPLNFLNPNNRLSGQTGLSSLRQPNILRSLQEQNKPEDEKKDKLDLSSFAKNAADDAIQQARTKPELGATNQIIVSEDGRFEASVDLKINSDGSFALDLAVRFAESSAVGVQSFTGSQEQITDETNLEAIEDQAAPDELESDEFALEDNPANLSLAAFDAIAARQTTFEQIVRTRDFQAEIYFQESKAVALSAQQSHGDGVASEFLGVSQQVAQEFTLNVSISGTDLNNFNAIAEELSQFDDTGTLGGFLEAARGVITSDSSNLSSFLGATKSLVASARDHVGAKLNDFFSGLGETFGEELDSLGLGFSSEFFENLGQDVNNDLNRFFDTTNQLFNTFGIDTSTNPETLKVDLLQQNLEQLREQQKEKLEDVAEIDLSSPRNDSLLTPEPQALGLDLLV